MHSATTVIRKFRLDELLPHPKAQRELIPSRVKKLVSDFDPEGLGVFHCVEYKIGQREGPWIVEGQHRWSAGMELGHGAMKVHVLMHCEVKEDSRSCDLFLMLNDRQPIAQYFKYMAELRAGHEQTVAIDACLRSYNLEASNQSVDGKVPAISSLRSVAGRNIQNLYSVLDIITHAWGTKAAAVDGKIIQGLGLVCASNNGAMDKATMIHKLAKYPGGPAALLGAARGLRELNKLTVPRCVATIAINTYNKGKRSEQLPPI